jgi:hypothetical protein
VGAPAVSARHVLGSRINAIGHHCSPRRVGLLDARDLTVETDRRRSCPERKQVRPIRPARDTS